MARFFRSRVLGVAASLLAAGCAAELPPPDVASHDEPAAASEPRAELRLVVDLPLAQRCAEAFDLALYEDRAIDLVAWDDQRGACAGRAVTIRYLSRLRREGDVLARVRALASRAEALPPRSSP